MISSRDPVFSFVLPFMVVAVLQSQICLSHRLPSPVVTTPRACDMDIYSLRSLEKPLTYNHGHQISLSSYITPQISDPASLSYISAGTHGLAYPVEINIPLLYLLNNCLILKPIRNVIPNRQLLRRPHSIPDRR